MSLGWQTESALLPSKAKPIAVDSKSMIGLKAAVYEGEQKLSNRGKRTISDLRRLQQMQAENKGAEAAASDTNKGVDARRAKDAHTLSEESMNEEKVAAALRAKSELYDKIKSGGVPVDSSSCLVDFKKGATLQPAAEVSPPPPPPVASRDARPAVAAWSWSRGGEPDNAQPSVGTDEPTSVEDYKRRKISETTFMQRIKDELATQRHEEAPHGRKTLSGAARVKSQWEKTLSGTSKEMLEQIHLETMEGRQAGENAAGDNTPTAKPKSAKEQRLQMIREKQEALKNKLNKNT